MKKVTVGSVKLNRRKFEACCTLRRFGEPLANAVQPQVIESDR